MIKKVAVVGAGIMGNQIAMQVAIHGYEVVCYDISEEMVGKAAAFSKDWFEKRIQGTADILHGYSAGYKRYGSGTGSSIR